MTSKSLKSFYPGITVCLLVLVLTSCKKNEFKNASGVAGTVPRTVSDAKNLWLDQNGYNQLMADMSDSTTAPKVRALCESAANAALSYTPVGYASVPNGEAGVAAGYLEALTLKWLSLTDPVAKQPYLDKAVEILKAWAQVNVQTWHRPAETALLPFYETYSVIRSSITVADRNIIDTWIRNRATVGAYRMLLQDGNAVNKVNNWEAIRICFLFYSAYILDDAPLLSSANSAYNTFLNNYLTNASGVTTDLKDRDALVYQAYGLYFVGFINNAVSTVEGASAAATLYQKVNASGYTLEQAITLWEPYLNGMYHDDFANSIFVNERTERRGPYKPNGDVYVLNVLVKMLPERLYPHIQRMTGGSSSRFSNRRRYLSMLNNINPVNPSTLGIDVSGTSYNLISALNNTSALDLIATDSTNGTKAVLWGPHSGPTRNWKLYGAGNDVFVLVNAMTSTKVLDVNGGKDSAGVATQIWAANDGKAQKWKITDAGSGYYTLSPLCAPTKFLDVNAAGTANGTKIQIWTSNSSNAQKWKIQPSQVIVTSTDSIAATADAYVRDGSYTSTNYGTVTGLPVKKDANTGYSRETYFKFDLSSIPTSIVSAKLKLFGTGNTTANTTQWSLYRVTDNSWTETGITWSNKPAAGTLLATIQGHVGASAREWNITSLVQSLAGTGPVSLKLVSTVAGGTSDVTFYSREATQNKPAIIFTYQ